jgi:uncharacterized protein (DUF885 family)
MSPALKFSIYLLVFLAAWWLVSFFWLKPWSIRQFYLRVLLPVLFESPQMLTMLGVLERLKINFHNALLGDVSEKHTDKMFVRLQRELKVLRSYPPERQDPATRLSTDILEYFLDDQLRGERFRYHDYPLNQMFGVQNEFPNFMATLHPVDGKWNAWNYVRRLDKSQKYFSQVLEGLRLREAKGVVPPRFVLRRVLDEMTAFTGKPARENLLYTAFQEKLGKLKLSEAEKQKLLVAAALSIEQTVYPAYQALIAYFTELEPKAAEEDGVWKLPDGEAYYAHCLRSHTTTDLSPAEVHQTGLQEVSRIEVEMSAILAQLGYPGDNVARSMDALGKEAAYQYANTDDARRTCLADFQRILDEIDQRIAPVFDLRPKAGLKVERMPEFREATAPGAYYMMGSLGGGRPGVFSVNLRDMKEVQKFGMKTLAYHEGIPGHHFQLSIAMELKGVPLFRRFIPFTAYAEGWALYAEKLAAELGAYQDDPAGRLGNLAAELFRAVRLVVDTGIHAQRWTRQQAIDYMLAHTGQPEPSVVSEVERYIVMPGQACAYKVGEIKLLALRQRMQELLGERFDLRRFHTLVLKNGAMPLSILERVIEAEGALAA